MKYKIGPEWALSHEKRMLDIIGVALAGPFAIPIVGIAAAAIKLDDGESPFFRQTRYTRGLRPFTMHKLRTMAIGAQERASMWGSAEGRTELGETLSRTHIDELPQLINVLRGDMSLAGPRPPIKCELELTRDVLDSGERTELSWAMGIVKAGVFSSYNLALHQNDYAEHSLRSRALDTIEFAHTTSFAGDMALISQGLSISSENIPRAMRMLTGRVML